MRVYLFNSLNPNGKQVPVTVNIEHSDKVNTKDGEVVYLITLDTGAKDLNGDRIDTVYIDNVTKQNVEKELNSALTTIGMQIDWGTLKSDIYPPRIMSISPKDKEENVSIHSTVSIKLKDPLPSSFINTSSVRLKVNGIDITNEVSLSENNNELKVDWIPVKILN